MAPKNRQHWQQVKETFHEALRLDPGARGPFLDKACNGDIEFRIEVESLLISLAEAKNFLEPPVIGTTPKPDSSWRLNAGEIISHYRIVSHIASGGMGEVYLAEDQKLYRQVALKVLPEHLNADKDRLRRFQREAQAVSTLNHPNILTIFEFDEQDSMHIFASEFVRGETLRERIKRGNLPVSECLDIGIQIASALQAAHSAGVIHRDIKPENIMIRDDGLVKVLDFGLAKLTERVSNSDADTQMHFLSHPGLIMGTAAYMSPEQARAVSIDARTDIFSLGVVQYEMLAGKPPFSGDTTADIIAAMIQSDPLRISSIVPSVPDDLDAIIAKAMKKDRNDRYASAAEMLVAMKLLRRQIETESETKETLSLDERSNADTKILEAKTYSEDFQRSSNDPISIAILPFRNLTRNTTVNFYSFSLADAVITELLRLRSLRVSPSSVIAKYEDYKDDPVTIAKELRVETVLAASYLVSDNRIRVTSQLIDVSNGQVLWGERIEATANDVITIQDTIAQHIIEGLQLNIGAQEARALIAMRSINPNAYEEYLRGRDCFLRYVYRTVDEKDISQAIGHFENAVELDPNFSLGFTALGTCYLNRIHKSFGTMQDITLARDALDKGIVMDLGDFDARAGRAYVHLIQGEKREAHKQLAELRKIVPHNATVHFYSMVLYRLSGDYENGLRSVNEVLRLNPAGQVVAGYNRSRFFMYQQRYNEAMDELTKAAKIEPNHPFVKFYTAIALFRTGDASSAKKILEELVIASPREAFRPHLAICLSSLGEHESAREQITEDLKRVAKTDPDVSYWLASAYLMENELNDAFDWLEYSIKIGNENLPWLESNPIWGPVRNDLRFRAIIQQLRDELYEVHSNIRRPNQLLSDTRDRPLNFKTTKEDLSGQRPESSQTTRRGVIVAAGSLMLFIFAAFFFGYWYFNAQNTKQTESTATNAQDVAPKLYWQMSDEEKALFVRERSQHVQGLIGDEQTDLDDDALKAIEMEIEYYVKRKDSLSQKQYEEGLRAVYGRGSQYAPLIISAYEKNNVPPALGLYQAMIESEFHDCPPPQVGYRGPVGMFQFSPSTAEDYGLLPADYCKVDKQADAAARHMSDLASDFGDGNANASLGLLSYMYGGQAVRKFLRQLRRQGITERSFWAIFQNRKNLDPPLDYVPPDLLPQPLSMQTESLSYVPRFFAATIIGETPDAFGLSTPPLTTLREINR